MCIQWGNRDDKAYSVTFPISYTTIPSIFVKTYSQEGDRDIDSNVYYSGSTVQYFKTGFKYNSGANQGNPYRYFWFSIGY